MKFSNNILKLNITSFGQSSRFNGKMVSFLSSDLFWILIVSGIFRLFYYSLFFDTLADDSHSYITLDINIFKGHINISRTPVYPYFIKLIKLFGEQNLIRNIIRGQIIVSFLTIILFYKIAGIIFKTRKAIIASTFLYGLMTPIINFDKIVLTEPLSICFILIFIYIVAEYIRVPTIFKAIAVTFFTFGAIMLRPAFIILLAVLIIFWLLRLVFYKKDKIFCFWGLCSSILVVLLVYGYSSLNRKQNGLFGISIVANMNQLDILLIADMYDKGNDPELTAVIDNSFHKGQTALEHWTALENIFRKYPQKRVADFIDANIKSQPKKYIKRIFDKIAELKTLNIFANCAHRKNGFLPRLVADVEFVIFFTSFNKVYLFVCFDFIFIIWQWIKTKQIPCFNIILWMLVSGQIMVAIVGAQGEYPRLILATIPCFIIIVFSYIDRICYAIDIHKLKKYKIFGTE